jgi:acetyltransferase-like isoleucine patch superfamily enzyme
MNISALPINLAGRLLHRIERAIAAAPLKRAKHLGRNVIIGRGVRVEHPECISLGDGVHLNDHCWLSVITENRETGRPLLTLHPELSIGPGTYIGRFGTLACVNRVSIGANVLIADRVFIGDSQHGIARTDLPIREQYMTSPGPVEIGNGTWLGINVAVLPNVKIGRNCVIGAHSVVTRDIPDFCVAVGSPARVIRELRPTA